MRFEARDESGLSIQVDADRAHGGTDSGMRPLELLLVSLGTCTAMDVISILRKKRQDVTNYSVEVTAKQRDEHPRIFTEISILHIVEGNNLSEEAVRRSIELSETKYCPAYAMLAEAIPITSSYRIRPGIPGPRSGRGSTPD